MTRERDYLDANGLAVTILTWDGESQVKQVALAKKGDRLVMIEIICESGAWKIFRRLLRRCTGLWSCCRDEI